MKRLTSLLSAVLLGTFTVAAFAAHTHVPTPSTWKLNISASDLGGMPAPKSDTMTMHTDTEKWLSWTEVVVDDKGKTTTSSWSGPQDGTMKPITGMPGAKASFKTADDTSHWETADGSSSDSVMTLSADKRQATIAITMKTKDGKTMSQKLVYDRVK